jgi:arsenate reductase
MTAQTPTNVLFLCTGNSARSILAEALLNAVGMGRLRGYSAGSHPRGDIHPLAIRILQDRDIPTVGLRSKSWDEFALPGAPTMQFVITVCDRAAREACPTWPHQPITTDWSLPDPAAPAAPAAQLAIFRTVFGTLERRIGMLAAVELHGADRARLEQLLIDIREQTPLVSGPERFSRP